MAAFTDNPIFWTVIGILITLIIVIPLLRLYYKYTNDLYTVMLYKHSDKVYLYDKKNPVHVNILHAILKQLSTLEDLCLLLKNDAVSSPLRNELLIIFKSIKSNRCNLKNLIVIINCIFYSQINEKRCPEREIDRCIRILLTTLRLLVGNKCSYNDKLVHTYDKLFWIQYKFIVHCTMCSNDRSFISPMILPISMPNFLLMPDVCYIQKTELECFKCRINLINDHYLCHIIHYPNYLIGYFQVMEYEKVEIFMIKLYLVCYKLIGFMVPKDKKLQNDHVAYYKLNDKWIKFAGSKTSIVCEKEVYELFMEYKIILCFYESQNKQSKEV